MIRALSTAATGLQAQQANIERISSDLANVNTDGYKKSDTEFQDLMYETVKEPGSALGASSQSPVGVQIGMGVKVGATHKVFQQGASRITNHPFDLMIEGKGFFPVQMPNGEVAFTRTGSFHLDSQGRVQTAGGALLLPQITVPSNSIGFVVTPQGEVKANFQDGTESTLGQIQVVGFQNEQGLLAAGGNLYKSSLASGSPIQSVPGENGVGTISQGAIEGSNVNVANSMVEMISTQRAYEMGTKVMGAVDQMMGATVNIK